MNPFEERNLCGLFVFFILMLSFVNSVFANNRQGAVTITPTINYFIFSKDRDFKASTNLRNAIIPGITLGYNLSKPFGVEALTSYGRVAPKGLGKASRVGLYTLNGVYHFLANDNFEPYLTGGIGLMQISRTKQDEDYQTVLNEGIGVQYFVAPSIAFRSDIRDIYTMSTGHHDMLATVGVSFLFLGKDRAATPDITNEDVHTKADS